MPRTTKLNDTQLRLIQMFEFASTKKEENEFVETTLEAFTLYLDRYKQKDGVSKCIDIVTGRVFY